MTQTLNRNTIEKILEKRAQKTHLKETAFLSIAGQGGVTAMEALASAAVNQGKHVYVAATITGARRLLPNTLIMRTADTSEIPTGEAPTNPVELMITDESLFNSENELVRRTVAAFQSGVLMVCTDKEPQAVDFPLSFEGTIATADAEAIFLDCVGLRPPPFAIAALGLYAAATNTVGFDFIKAAAAYRLRRLRPNMREANLKALELTYQTTKILKGVRLTGKQDSEQYVAFVPPAERGDFTLRGASSAEAASFWRDSLPVCDQRKCTCIECVVAYTCPEGVVKWKDEVYTVDYDFCRGCGVCAQECPEKAITLKPALEVLASLAK